MVVTSLGDAGQLEVRSNRARVVCPRPQTVTTVASGDGIESPESEEAEGHKDRVCNCLVDGNCCSDFGKSETGCRVGGEKRRVWQIRYLTQAGETHTTGKT